MAPPHLLRPGLSRTAKLWGILCEKIGWRHDQHVRLWMQLSKARHPYAVQWHKAYRAFVRQLDATPEGADVVYEDFVRTIWHPKAIVQMIEALVEDGRLRRKEATALEEHIFARMTPPGDWRPFWD